MSSAPDGDTVERRLTQVVERLNLPNSTLQITQVRLNRLGTEPDIDDERMDEVAAAALALSCREDGLPVSEADIADTWSGVLDAADSDVSVSGDQLSGQIGAVAEYLDLGDPPAHPGELIREYGHELGTPDGLIEVARTLLQDSFEADATVVAGGTSPGGTAGATLYLAAEINGLDDEYTQAALGEVSDTSEVTVRNRYGELRDLLGEDRLERDRYRYDVGETPEAAAATDGNSDATAAGDDGPPVAEAEVPDAGEAGGADPTSETADGGTAAGTAHEDVAPVVESEIDGMADDMDVSPSARLMARGMVGDAVDGVAVEDAPELAAAALIAGARMGDGGLEPAEVAEVEPFDARSISRWLDHLEGAVDVDIPRRDADEVVARLVADLELSEEVREESLRALEQYRPEEIDADYTSAELGAGTVFFAATVGRTQVDIDELARVTGADPGYITDAMNSVVVSLCLSLVRGDIDYEECSWTTDLLESELSPDIGDSYTGQVIAVAKTYTAGRERRHIDDATLDVVLSSD